jgi:DNA transformation protein
MKNLGPVSAARLRAAGIETPEELRRVGAVEAYVRLKRTFPVETTHVSLYALHGAVTDIRWYVLPEEARAALRDAASRRL